MEGAEANLVIASEEMAGVNPASRLFGSLVTLATLLTIALLSRSVLAVPDPTAFYLLAVAFAASRGGPVSGMLVALGTVLHSLYLFSEPGRAFHYAGEDLRRLVLLAAAAPAIAVLVGTLNLRAGRRARRESAEGTGPDPVAGRLRVEEDLHREREFLRAVLEQLEDGVVACDGDPWRRTSSGAIPTRFVVSRKPGCSASSTMAIT